MPRAPRGESVERKAREISSNPQWSALSSRDPWQRSHRELRWSSGSRDALVLDNVAFDNRERGIAIEETDGVLLRRNRLVNNAVSQLLVNRSAYGSESNCFTTRGADQLVADFFPFHQTDRHRTLDEYRKAKRQDVHAAEGDCGPLPEKLDVRRLHADTVAYAERARAGGGAATREGERGWLDWLFRRGSRRFRLDAPRTLQ